MKQISIACIAILTLAACAPGAEVGLESTAVARAATWVAGTQTAEFETRIEPSNTPAPPATTSESATLAPTQTTEPTTASTPTLASETLSPTGTPPSDPSNNALLRFENNTDGVVFVLLDGPIHGEFSFSDSWNLPLPRGDYTYSVWIGDDGPYAGSFTLTNADKHTLRINTDQVRLLGP